MKIELRVRKVFYVAPNGDCAALYKKGVDQYQQQLCQIHRGRFRGI